MSSRRFSVSPILICPNTADPVSVVADQLAAEDAMEAEVKNLKDWAVLSEPIVGVEVVTLDERGQGALPPKELPSPKEPTPAARARHNLTHLPYEDWCPFCVACRRPNSHHRLQLREEHEQPLLVGDYAFIRNSGDDQLVCLLVCCLYPFRIYLTCVVPNKGVHEFAIKRLERFIADTGLVKFNYRSDNEPNLVAMFQAACVGSGRQGTDVSEASPLGPKEDQVFDCGGSLIDLGPETPANPSGSTALAIPEHSHPGESQSNGKAEAAVKDVVKSKPSPPARASQSP